MEITLEEIQKKFESLPEDLRWAIMAANVDEKITAMGKEHNLTVEQMGQLSLETHMVMFGFTHPNKFEESVKASLGFPEDKNKIIVNEINEKILKDIRERLMTLYGKAEEKKNEEIMTGAGIEIMPTEAKEQASTSQTVDTKNLTENSDDMLKKIENPEIIAKEKRNEEIARSISSQKLSGSFQVPSTKTEYSLPNTEKELKKNITEPVVGKAVGSPKIDPYREPVE
ncbi:hypothetical protein KKA39_01500 [Patescibacteria group bacterium]|nr:hypothetical protein [Patescibacteria group bacterium]